MKNRRKFVVAILLTAVVCIGAGYALEDAVINGTGTVKYNPSFAITWGSAFASEGRTENVTIIESIGTENLTFTVDTSSWTIGESVTVKATVKNDSHYGANSVNIKADDTDISGSSYYTVSVEREAETIAVGGEIWVTITVTMKAYPKVTSSYSKDFTFTVTASQDSSVTGDT